MAGGRDKWRPYELKSYIHVNPFALTKTGGLSAGRIGIRPLQPKRLHKAKIVHFKYVKQIRKNIKFFATKGASL